MNQQQKHISLTWLPLIPLGTLRSLLLASHTLHTNQGPTYWPATPAAASVKHASYKPRTNILTSDTKGILSHSHSFTTATIINFSLLCCLKRSFVIHLCCLIIYSVREINHFPETLKQQSTTSLTISITPNHAMYQLLTGQLQFLFPWTRTAVDLHLVMNRPHCISMKSKIFSE